jgi:organic radical activating enzyme
VVFTGGEPALQLDRPLIDALHARGFEIAIETNGTLDLPAGIDWVCVSPKAGTTLRITSGDELKLIHPQSGAEPENYANLPFRHFFLQPMDGPRP